MNNYHLYEELHRSGTCTVYKARKRATIEYMVVKCVDKTRKAALLKEVMALGSLKGIKGIPDFHCWYETRNHYWLCEEFCPGGDLEQVIACDMAFPEPNLKALVLQVAASLFAVHTKGCLHGNLIMKNVLFSEDGSIRICDWGGCRIEERNNATPFDWRKLPVSKDLAYLGKLIADVAGIKLDEGGVQAVRTASISNELKDLILILLSNQASWEQVSNHNFWRGDLLKVETGIGSFRDLFYGDQNEPSDQNTVAAGTPRAADKSTTPRSKVESDQEMATVKYKNDYLQRQDQMDTSVFVSADRKAAGSPDALRMSVIAPFAQTSFMEALDRCRTLAQDHLNVLLKQHVGGELCRMPELNPEVIAAIRYSAGNLSIDEAYHQATKFLAAGNIEAVLALIGLLVANPSDNGRTYISETADSILNSKITACLSKPLSQSVLVSQTVGVLLRAGRKFLTPLWGLPDLLYRISSGSQSVQNEFTINAASPYEIQLSCFEALGEFILKVSPHRSEWGEMFRNSLSLVRGVIMSMGQSFVAALHNGRTPRVDSQTEMAAFVTACKIVEGLCLNQSSQCIARSFFFGPELFDSLARGFGKVSPIMQPQVFNVLFLLGRIDVASSESVACLNDFGFTSEALMALAENTSGQKAAIYAASLLRDQLQKGKLSAVRVSSMCHILGNIAGNRGSLGSRGLYALCECFSYAPEATVRAGGMGLDRRLLTARKGDHAMDDASACFAGLVAAAASEGNIHLEVLESTCLAQIAFKRPTFVKLLASALSNGPTWIARLLEALAMKGDSILSLWEDVNDKLLSAVIRYLSSDMSERNGLDRQTKFQLVKGFCEVAGQYLTGPEFVVKGIVSVIAERLCPIISDTWLLALEDPLPRVFLSMLINAYNAIPLKMRGAFKLNSSKLRRFCEGRLANPQSLQTLSILTSLGEFNLFHSRNTLNRTCELIEAASAGESENLIGEAAAELIQITIESKSISSKEDAEVLNKLINPLCRLSTLQWASELLIRLTQGNFLPCYVAPGQCTALPEALRAVRQNWTAAMTLLSVAEWLILNRRIPDPVLKGAVADLVMAVKDSGPRQVNDYARQIYHRL